MNIMLFDFYRGVGTDNRGRSFEDMLTMSDVELEKSHDVIQWLFPLTEVSKHNPAAPLLDQETIQAMQQDQQCQLNLIRAGERFVQFLIQNYVEKPFWITPKNHNFLRLTRIIKCYVLFGSFFAQSFYFLAKYYYQKFPSIIGEETWQFWQDAIKEQEC